VDTNGTFSYSTLTRHHNNCMFDFRELLHQFDVFRFRGNYVNISFHQESPIQCSVLNACAPQERCIITINSIKLMAEKEKLLKLQLLKSSTNEEFRSDRGLTGHYRRCQKHRHCQGCQHFYRRLESQSHPSFAKKENSPDVV